MSGAIHEGVNISTHALREEGDKRFGNAAQISALISTHALREEGDLVRKAQVGRLLQISTHALREEGDSLPVATVKKIKRISTHALGEEGYQARTGRDRKEEKFLPTPSARRATRAKFNLFFYNSYFYPRPPRGGRHGKNLVDMTQEEFLPTPSARRATIAVFVLTDVAHPISTHALREEGDNTGPLRRHRGKYFYPRPPRGGRRSVGVPGLRYTKFLPTPSARRATARCPRPCRTA